MPPANEEELALCQRAGNGDVAAFGALVAANERSLRAFLTRMGSGDAADDVAQEAFLKAWRSIARFDGRSRFTTWLTKIAWRLLIDHSRRQRPIEVDDSASVESAGQAIMVQDMLSRLPQTERAALLLCEGQGWTHQEAAVMLGMPLGSLKSRIARAKERCRSMWMEAQA